MYRHILIPTDGSELARRAVHHGLSLAKSVGAKVTALTVEGSFNVYDVPASKVYEMSGSFAEHVERTKAHAEKILNGVTEEARSAGVTCETMQVEQDHPYEAIIDTAQRRGEAHWRSGIASILFARHDIPPIAIGPERGRGSIVRSPAPGGSTLAGIDR